jgi:VIT1/CCC1 family predicted Fe2+/Mn2+ transporter
MIGSGTAAVLVSAVVSVLALFAVGAATSVFTGRHAGRAGLRMAIIGAAVAAVTFLVGTAVGANV